MVVSDCFFLIQEVFSGGIWVKMRVGDVMMVCLQSANVKLERRKKGDKT